MKRYFPNNDDEGDEEDFDEEMYLSDEASTNLINMMSLNLAEVDLNHKLLRHAHEIASKDIFWFFRSTAFKLHAISESYLQLVALLEATSKQNMKKEEPNGDL